MKPSPSSSMALKTSAGMMVFLPLMRVFSFALDDAVVSLRSLGTRRLLRTEATQTHWFARWLINTVAPLQIPSTALE